MNKNEIEAYIIKNYEVIRVPDEYKSDNIYGVKLDYYIRYINEEEYKSFIDQIIKSSIIKMNKLEDRCLMRTIFGKLTFKPNINDKIINLNINEDLVLIKRKKYFDLVLRKNFVKYLNSKKLEIKKENNKKFILIKK